MDLIHKRFLRPGMPVMQHLIPNTVSTSQICEICKMTVARAQISRKSQFKATAAFDLIHADLIHPSTSSFNAHRFINHMMDDATYMRFVMTGIYKTPLTPGITQLKAYARTHFQKEIHFIHSDSDPVLNALSYFADNRATGTIAHKSVAHNHEQNAKIERANQHFSQLQRAFHIESRLPAFLFPEFYRTSAYIANRTPMKALHWKSPYESLHGTAPDTPNLRRPGSKSFVRNPLLPRGDKTSSRVHIGFLVGYEASNIWRIWVHIRVWVKLLGHEMSFSMNLLWDIISLVNFHLTSPFLLVNFNKSITPTPASITMPPLPLESPTPNPPSQEHADDPQPESDSDSDHFTDPQENDEKPA